MIYLRKLYVYMLFSFGLFSWSVVDATARDRYFYDVMVALFTSKIFAAFSANAFIAATILCCLVLLRLFFGRLQPFERQDISPVITLYAIETAIALIYFGTPSTLAMAGLFLLGISKFFHCMTSLRREQLEQEVQANAGGAQDFLRQQRRSALRLAFFAVLLAHWDVLVISVCTFSLMHDGFSVVSLMLLEGVIQSVVIVNVMFQFMLHETEVFLGRPWELKGTLRFYCDMLFSLITSALNIAFFFALSARVGLPVHLIRPLITNTTTLFKTVKSFFSYRRLTKELDSRFPDATEADLEHDRTCSICYDELEAGPKTKALPCRHCFHRACLWKWLERNSACPYCRQSIDELLKADEKKKKEAQERQQQPRPQPQQQPRTHPEQTDTDAVEEALEASQQSQLIHEAYLKYCEMYDNHQRALKEEQQARAAESLATAAAAAARATWSDAPAVPRTENVPSPVRSSSSFFGDEEAAAHRRFSQRVREAQEELERELSEIQQKSQSFE